MLGGRCVLGEKIMAGKEAVIATFINFVAGLVSITSNEKKKENITWSRFTSMVYCKVRAVAMTY